MVKPIGIVKKIVALQQGIVGEIPITTTNTSQRSTSRLDNTPLTRPSSSPISPTLTASSPTSPSLHVQDWEALSTSSAASISSATSLTNKRKFSIPTKWKPNIMAAIREEKLYPDVRNEIVRDLVTHIYAHVDKPDVKVAIRVAESLVKEYPFMSDSGNNPSGSWQKKIMDRVYNVEKTRKRKGGDTEEGTPAPKKRGRPKVITLASRYPPLRPQEGDDEATEERNMQALSKEMEKEKPRKEVVLPLMKLTFYARRQFVVREAKSVVSIIQKFPALKMPSVIEQEMELILNKQGLQRSFTTDWNQKWVPAIVEYSKGLKRKDIKMILRDLDQSADDQKGAMTLLYPLLCVQPKTKKGGGQSLCYVYDQCKISDKPEDVASSEPRRDAPWIGEFIVDDGDPTYFIFAEQIVVCSVNSFSKALFLWFSLHYVFNVEYDDNVKDFCLFFQEFAFGLPSSCRKTSTYLSTTTDINSFALH